MLRRSLICLLSALCAASLQGQVVKQSAGTDRNRQWVTNANFYSSSIGHTVSYSLILPAGYAQTNRRYPVLYLLHGLYGDPTNWLARTNLVRDAKSLPIIIIMPDAGNSWYTNSATNKLDAYETFIAKDLVEEIDTNYHTMRSREGRFIAGISMGGYAAIKLALKNPNQYSLAASLSGAFSGPVDLDLVEEYRAQLLKVFGPAGSQTRIDNDVFQLAVKAKADQLPYLSLSCGASDPFLKTNRDLVVS
jgi:putative tributyrin esterase